MAECGLFRQLLSFWRDLISRSENATNSTEQSPWEAKSHPVSQEISCPSWNPNVLYHIYNNPPLYHILNHKDAVHIFVISSIKSTLILLYNLIPISHKTSLPLTTSCLKFFVVLSYKTWFQCLLSMPVNNTTHAQHFPPLTFNTILQSRISRTLKPSLQ